MENNFLNLIPEGQISEEKITAILINWSNETLNDKHAAFGIYRKMLVQECSKLTKPFLELIKFHAKPKEKENFDQIEKEFLKRYQTFTDTFRNTLQSNRSHFYLFCYISVGFTEVIDQFQKEAHQHRDLIASQLALQLQTDINRIVDEEFENKKAS